jgi:hypothetical protein
MKRFDFQLGGLSQSLTGGAGKRTESLRPGGSKLTSTGVVAWTVVATTVIYALSHPTAVRVGLPPPVAQAQISPTELKLDNQTTAGQVTVKSIGAAPLTVRGALIEGPNKDDFAIDNRCAKGRLEKGRECQISVILAPQATEGHHAELIVKTNAAEIPYVVQLSWPNPASPLTVSPPVIIPSELSFGDQEVGASGAVKSVTLSLPPDPSGLLRITAVGVSGASRGDFTKVADTCTDAALQPSKGCTISMKFMPVAQGMRTATLRISDNAEGGLRDVLMTGIGTFPGIVCNPAQLYFASRTIGSRSAAQSVTCTNSGTAPLRITAVTVSGENAGDFIKAEDNCGTATVAPRESCSIVISFGPQGRDTRNGILTINDNAGGSPHKVPLTGGGAPLVAAVALDRKSLEFGVGTSSPDVDMQFLRLTSIGTAPFSVSSVELAGAQAPDFQISEEDCTAKSPIAPGGSCRVGVRFAPRVIGACSANLLIKDNVGHPSYTVPVKGSLNYDGALSGSIIWSGRLEPGGTFAIKGSHASFGSVRGELPGVPVEIDIDSNRFAVALDPGPQNSWREVAIRSKKGGQLTVTIRWTVLQ